jgi:hypothetical protein
LAAEGIGVVVVTTGEARGLNDTYRVFAARRQDFVSLGRAILALKASAAVLLDNRRA